MNETETMNGKPVHEVDGKTVINFESGFKNKLLCDGPTFSAGYGCAYSCTYCYVPNMMRKLQPMLEAQGVTGPQQSAVIRRRNAVEIVRRQLTNRKGEPLYNSPANLGRVIYASPMVDVAANMALVEETAAICKTILELTAWDIRLLSKSNLLPEVAKCLEQWPILTAKQRVIYGVSTGTLNDGIAHAIEPDAPLVSSRTESLHWLQNHGHRTFGMICPSLPIPNYDYPIFSTEASRMINADRCEHVWAECLNARGESMTNTINALQFSGYGVMATSLQSVTISKTAWEHYTRQTFSAHADFIPAGKLRFMQYVGAGTQSWWEGQKERGAVLL